jgi:hypothetical protein
LKLKELTTLKMLGIVLLGGSLLSVWPGCKDSSNAGASADPPPSVAQPLVINAVTVAPDDNPMAGPLSSPFWAGAHWRTFNTANADQDSGTITRAAVAYNQTDLYVAYICTGSSPRYDPSAAKSDLWRNDCVEIWLDTSKNQNGTNFFEIVASPDGRTNQVWHSSATPPQPGPDGELDLDHPYGLIPWNIAALKTAAATGSWQNQSAWTLVIQIPLKSMPKPLACSLAAGDRFKINLLRYEWSPGDTGQPDELTQYSLFPVPAESQALAPYLMGRLVLESLNEENLAYK